MACCPSSLFRCASGGAEFLAHARRASSYNVRGHMCALLERLIQNALEEETEGNPALTFEHWQTQTATGIARMGGDMKPVCIRRHRRRHAGAASLHVRGTSCVPAALLTPSLSYSQHVSLSPGLASVCRLVLAYPGYGCSQQVGPG